MRAFKVEGSGSLGDGITHVLLGGQLRRLSGSLTGALALANLEQFSFDVAFIGVSGLTENGITVPTSTRRNSSATWLAFPGKWLCR